MEKIRAVDAGVPAEQWRKVSPLTPALNTWQYLLALIAFLTYQNSEILLDVYRSGVFDAIDKSIAWFIILGSLALILAILGGFSWLSWRATSWAISDTAVWYKNGIIFRTQKHARLDRIQAVDIIHPLLGRLVGLGRLHIEVAGGSDSNFTIGYLRSSQLTDVRIEILARAAGLKVSSILPSGDEGAGEGLTSAPDTAVNSENAGVTQPQVSRLAELEAPERPLFIVNPTLLVQSLARSMGVIISAVLIMAALIGIGVLFYKEGASALGVLVGFVPILFGFGSYLWGRFAKEFNFTVAVSPDGIRIRKGLTETRSQTIPPRRVHGVEVSQPWLWRSKGWYRVTILQAGYGMTESSESTGSSNVLLPVGTREQAELALWLVIRDLGVEDPRAFLDAAFNGTRNDSQMDGPTESGEPTANYFVGVPRAAKLFNPLEFPRLGYALTSTVAVLRQGRIQRTTTFLPYERMQSFAINSGPWDRKRGLANIHLEMVPGSISTTLSHVDASTVHEVMAGILEKSKVRRDAEPPEQWMRRVEEGLDEVADEASNGEAVVLLAGESIFEETSSTQPEATAEDDATENREHT